MLFLVTFCLFPATVFSQQLVIAPPDLTIMEGESGDFTVLLSSEPTAEVTVTIVISDGTEISLDKTELIFTPSNWSQPQKVRMEAVQDMDRSDHEGRLILIASGTGYSESGIIVSPDTVKMGSIGETFQLSATIQDQEGVPVVGVDLEWMSANSSTAKVDSTGTVTGVGLGETTIVATLATASGSAIILVGDVDNSQSLDREILETLYQATGGENWVNQDGWLTSTPLNNWYGVDTDSEGYVTKLVLIENNLRGVIPLGLGKLQRLESLDLYRNFLTGPIPFEFGDLSRLKELTLEHNSLTGSIPSELGNLSQLERLSLIGNELTGSVPPELGNLSQLEYLGLSVNPLTGSIPPELGSLPQLTELALDYTSLTGSIPPELGNLSQLISLSLVGNELTGSIPPELGNLSQLEILNLAGNELAGSVPSELGSLPQLKQLILSVNSLTGSIPPELGNLSQLQALRLFTNELTGSIPPELGNLSQLEGLFLSENELTGSIPSELGSLPQLTELLLSMNSLMGSIPPELGNLSQLQALWLFENKLTGSIPSELGNLSRLQTLWISSNELTGSIPSELGNLSQVGDLNLNGNSLTGSIPSELGNLSQLKGLSMVDNDLTGSIPPELGNLSQLESMFLQGNKLTGSIPSELGNLSQLQTLWLFENELAGSIPPELGNLSQLEYLALSKNELTGSIPSELGSLSQLTELILSTNSLTGSIPPELGNLSQLKLLWLSENELMGSIPPDLRNLTSLNHLHLSNNKDLDGLLPRSLIRINPISMFLDGTGVCRQQDSVFMEWWNDIPDTSGGECLPRQIDRLALMELYNKTNGPMWTSRAGWGSVDLSDVWHGVTLENGRVTQLSLSDNLLVGQIPSEVANFTALRVLNLTENSLTGPLPEEISLLSDLSELRVNGNPALQGPLGYGLTNLTKLEVLYLGGTSLCVSPAPAFQTWYMGIRDTSGKVCGNPTEVSLDIPVAYLVQSIQTPQNSVPLIEGRDALLRAFVTGGTVAEPAFFEPQVVATIQGGGRTYQVTMTQNSDRLEPEVDESDLNHSFNAVIPGEFITQDATLIVDADPEDLIPRANDSQDRFPSTGEVPLNVVSVPAMEVTVVPVLEADMPDRSIFSWTDNIDDNSSEVGLFKHAFPFHEFRATSRDPYVTSLDVVSDDGAWGLMLELEALRMLDNATGYYYGAAASVNGYVRGLAIDGGWVSMGKPWDEELAHEVGHNFDLRHAPCGDPLRTDPDFPHSGGSVGAWGYDFRDGTLISPAYHKDIMGYCYTQGWLSDYYFEKVIDYRERIESKQRDALEESVDESGVLVLWGGVQGGELRIEPPFLATATAQLPEMNGPYRLDGIGQDTVLFSISFTPGEDKYGGQYFFFALPVQSDWEASLERITLTDPEGQSTAFHTSDPRTLSIFRDPSTGMVRGIIRDWNGEIPPALNEVGDLSIVTTQGLMDSIQMQR